MTKEQLQKAKEIEEKLQVVDNYISKFNPERTVVWLHVTDQYGNGKMVLPLYAHGEKESHALGSGDNNLTKHYRVFLEACTDDLIERKTELEQALQDI